MTTSGFTATDDLGAVVGLIALTGIDVVADGVGSGRGAVDQHLDAEAAGVEHEPLAHGRAGRDRDLARDVGAPEGGIDDVVAGLEADRRARVALGHQQLRLVLLAGYRLVDPPRQALIDALAIDRQQRDEIDLGGRVRFRCRFAGGSRNDGRVGRHRDGCRQVARPRFIARRRQPAAQRDSGLPLALVLGERRYGKRKRQQDRRRRARDCVHEAVQG